MKCVIPGANVKVFGRAIHSLSKIGDEVYIDPMQHGLGLRTVNLSRSAYGCFMFYPSFFQHYDESEDDETEPVRCKINMKSCLTVFKSLSHLERTVDRCKITLNTKIARVIFQLYCKHGIVKTYNLAFIECESLQAVFSKDLCPNAITSQSRLLCDVVVNFQTSQEEVTLSVNPLKVSLRNYVEDEPDPNKVIHTEMTLIPDEFDAFQVGLDSEVTFCLKELRAILAFSEAGNLPLSMHFESAGKPIVFSIDGDNAYEANFVLATLADAPASQSSQATQPNRVPAKNPRISTMSSAKKRPTQSSRRVPPADIPRATTSKVKTNGYHERDKEKGSREQEDDTLQNLMNDDLDWDIPMELGEGGAPTPKKTDTQPRTEQLRQDGSGESESPEIPNMNQKLQINLEKAKPPDLPVPDVEGEEEEEEDDLVPGTPPPPPNKRFKSLFFGSQSQASSVDEEIRPTPVILAEDTDEED